MIELAAESFHDTMAAHSMIVCTLHHGPFEDWGEAVSVLRAGSVGTGSWFWTRLDVSAAPTIANMFRVSDGDAKLLVMRECVVLHCGPLASASPATTSAIIDRAAQLDMVQVREEIEQERLSRESLFIHRVCPATRRSR